MEQFSVNVYRHQFHVFIVTVAIFRACVIHLNGLNFKIKVS